ncbi:MAG: CDP-glycerol glycerophosphotransferase family protein [Candidatus Limnocylindrales bacterium]
MSRLEYLLASALLRVVGLVADLIPIRRDRVVLATARTPILEGNLLFLHDAIRRLRPDLQVTLLLEPYAYGLRGKFRYLGRLVRGMVLLRTARWFIVDNAYLPIHVAAHRNGTTVVQVWHAVGALKRFGWDAGRAPHDPERRFLHRHYDWVVCSAERSRGPYAAAFRTASERVLPLGTPRVDAFADAEGLAAARARVVGRYPALAGRRVILYAPTFRGRGAGKRAAADGLDGVALRAALPADDILVLKTHPNLDRAATPTAGFDLVIDPVMELNDLLAATDVLVTDYSSSIFEWALLRRPLVLLVPDLVAYEQDPGLYLDYRTEMIGTQVSDTAGVAVAILAGRFDLTPYDAFVERHLGAADGRASERFVRRFLGPGPAEDRAITAQGATLPPDVRHE